MPLPHLTTDKPLEGWVWGHKALFILECSFRSPKALTPYCAQSQDKQKDTPFMAEVAALVWELGAKTGGFKSFQRLPSPPFKSSEEKCCLMLLSHVSICPRVTMVMLWMFAWMEASRDGKWSQGGPQWRGQQEFPSDSLQANRKLTCLSEVCHQYCSFPAPQGKKSHTTSYSWERSCNPVLPKQSLAGKDFTVRIPEGQGRSTHTNKVRQRQQVWWGQGGGTLVTWGGQ